MGNILLVYKLTYLTPECREFLVVQKFEIQGIGTRSVRNNDFTQPSHQGSKTAVKLCMGSSLSISNIFSKPEPKPNRNVM